MLRKVGKDYAAASGTITFSETGERTSADFEVWEISKDEIVKITSL